jgi:hypothetical protein
MSMYSRIQPYSLVLRGCVSVRILLSYCLIVACIHFWACIWPEYTYSFLRSQYSACKTLITGLTFLPVSAL